MGLSKVQQKVLDLLHNDWELGVSHAFGQRCWLQKGKIGEGGESIDISHATLGVLFDKGLIERRGKRYNITIFGLKNADN